MMISRRHLLTQISLLSGSTVIFGCSGLRASLPHAATPSRRAPSALPRADFPIDHQVPLPAPRTYFGPNPEKAHSLLWTHTTKTPSSWENHSGPVIIGGGISGLSAAYSLINVRPIVLEADSHLGGNSQGHSWEGSAYSIGAAYLVSPEPDTEVHTLLDSLGLLSEMRIPTDSEAYALNSVLRHDLIQDSVGQNEQTRARIQKFRLYISSLLEDSESSRYPNIPTEDPSHRSYINQLDRVSLMEHLEQICEGEVPSPLRTAIEQYCWSAFGGSSFEISAASGLNFYASESADIAVFAGGNARIAERLCEEIASRCGNDSLRTSCIVTRVAITESGVEILYHDESGELRGLRAPRVVVSCPKFVVKRIVKDLPPEYTSTIQRLRYRAYLTANVLFARQPSLQTYDLYLLKEEHQRAMLPSASLAEITATDVILGSWASPHPSGSVLTLYRALPYDGGRVSLLGSQSYEDVRKNFERQISEEICPLFGLSTTDLIDIRIARFGHALPLSEVGLISSGAPDILRTPIQEKIFFAQQDNWAVPALEVAIHEGLSAASQLLRSL